MSDISSVSGETDSQLDNMFPQDDEEEVEGLDRPIHSTTNNLGTITSQNQQAKAESDIDFDSDDDNDVDDADSDIFDDDIQDSQLEVSMNDGNSGNKLQTGSHNDSSNTQNGVHMNSRSQNQMSGISKKKPRNFHKSKETNSDAKVVSFAGKTKPKTSIDEESEVEEQDDDDILDEEGESQSNEKDNQDDFSDESFLQSSENLDSQRQRRDSDNKSSDDLDLSFSNETSNQITAQQRHQHHQHSHPTSIKRKNSLKPSQGQHFGSPRASRKNSEILQKENSMIQVSKPSDKLKKQYRKYQELAQLIPTLRNFDWYETTAFQNKLLPSKSIF